MKSLLKKIILFIHDNITVLVFFIAVTAIFSVLLYPSVSQTVYLYNIGDVAKRDIKAPVDFFIKDTESTMQKQKEAAESILTVYDIDKKTDWEVKTRAQTAFSSLRKIMKTKQQNAGSATSLQMKEEFEKQIGFDISNGAYKLIEKEEFAEYIPDYINRILTEILDNGVVKDKELLLREGERGITIRDPETGQEYIEKNLRIFYSLEQALAMVRIIGQPMLKDVNYNIKNLIVDFAQRLIRPNIVINIRETEQKRARAEKEINSIMYKIKAGEMLIREGEIVTSRHQEKLLSLNSRVQKTNIWRVRTGAALVLLSILLSFYIINVRAKELTKERDKNLLFLSVMLVLFFIVARFAIAIDKSLLNTASFPMSAESVFFATPMVFIPMLICIFMGMRTSLHLTIIMAVTAGLIFGNRLEIFIYFLLSGIMASFWVRHCRERFVFIKAGAKTGLFNVVLAILIKIYINSFSTETLCWDSMFAFSGGLISAILTAGIAPLIETAFGYTSDIKLLEFANSESPLLRKLFMQAPGTYHHSVVVGSMADAAASAIRANPILARAGGYYHDIGKINKPLYFVENQDKGENKHDKLAPSMSKHILISHVKDGVKIAKEGRISNDIIDIISQSHGTSLISFFYEKARQHQKEDETVNIEDYRYPGPKPQTREAGLVMLADIVEAASRTLEEPTPARIKGLVQNLINKVFSDEQLSDCEITLKDLNIIAKIYIKTLTAIYHNRVEYPEKQAKQPERKNLDAGNDKKRTNSKPAAEKDNSKSKWSLKRLGQT